MQVSSLKELYSRVNKHFKKVFVVPLIRYDYPKTDYLYLLYEDMILHANEIEVKSISVFNHYKFVIAAIFSNKSILHYHWLEFQNIKALLGMPYKMICIGLYKLFGGTIVWTVHNLKPHDKKFLDFHHFIHKWMAKNASIIHVHSPSACSVVSEYLEVLTDKILVLKHPEFPFDSVPKEEAIQDFLANYGDGRTYLEKPVFLIFGGISEYKGIREIIEFLTSKENNFTLIIAGYVKVGQESLHRFIIKKTIDDNRVIYIPSFIPEEHYPHLLQASDICVFNYDEILTSGGVEMAKAYQKKIIAPNRGCLQDLKDYSNISLFNTKNELEELLLKSLNGSIDD